MVKSCGQKYGVDFYYASVLTIYFNRMVKMGDKIRDDIFFEEMSSLRQLHCLNQSNGLILLNTIHESYNPNIRRSLLPRI